LRVIWTHMTHFISKRLSFDSEKKEKIENILFDHSLISTCSSSFSYFELELFCFVVVEQTLT
jgi:hypothetical protein